MIHRFWIEFILFQVVIIIYHYDWIWLVNHFHIFKTSNGWIFKVYTFEHLGNILKFSGEKKLQEVRSCLEGLQICCMRSIECLYLYALHIDLIGAVTSLVEIMCYSNCGGDGIIASPLIC